MSINPAISATAPFFDHSRYYGLALLWAICCSPFILNCAPFDPNENCLNPQASCFAHQTVAPYVVSYVPIPNRGSTTVNKLTGIQVTFSQRIKGWLNPEKYQLTNLGNLQISSVEQTGTYTVTLNLAGKLANGNVDLSFPGLSNFTGLAFAKGTFVRLIGNLDIGVNILDAQSTYFVSSAGGTGKTSAVVTWSHDYRIDPQNNNTYTLKLGGSTCADAGAITGGTNITGSNLPGNTPVTSTIPLSGNFGSAGTYFVRICVQNHSGFNKSGEGVAIVIHDYTSPLLQASVASGVYGALQNVSLRCTDNCRQIAYNVATGSSPQGAPAAPVFNADGSLQTGMPFSEPWTTPYSGDSTYTTITAVAIDNAGNQSAPLVLSYQINSSLPVISLASPAINRTYISANSAQSSATIRWQANQSGNYQVCLGGGGCTAGPGCGSGSAIGSVQSYVQGNWVNTQVAANDLSAGNNTIHICVSNGAQVADSSLSIYRSDTAPAVAAITPGDLTNAIPSSAAIAVVISDPLALDLSTVTTNTSDASCSGTLQISLSSDDFAPNTCVQMNAQPEAVASQTFLLKAAGGFNPGVYKVRITTGLKDIAGNALASTYTLNAGFAVSGLLRQFTFGNDSTDIQDRAFTGFHLSAFGNPKKVNGADGDALGAYKFDGSGNDYLRGLDTGLPLGQGPRTICAWVNTASQCGTNCVALMYGDSGGAYLGNRTNTGAYGFAGGTDYLGGTPLKLNTWTHLCHVYDGNNLRIYLNGIQDGSAAIVAGTTLGGGVVIGKASGSATQSAFNGRVDDVRLYAGALSPSAIRQIAVQVPAGLLLYYSFSDAASLAATDYSNNGHNGVLAGNPTAVADRFGNTGAYNFSATSQSISAVDDGLPSAKSARTVCSWVMPAALPTAGSYAIAARYGSPAVGEAQVIGLYNDGTITKAFYGAWGDNLTAGLPVQLNSWMHICGTYDGDKAALYVNGTNVASATKQWNTLLLGANGVFVGQGDSSGTTAFTGRVDDVRIYGRVLQQHEITTLSSQLSVGLLRQYSFQAGVLTEDNGGPALTAFGSPTLGNNADGGANGAYVLNGTSQYLSTTDAGLPVGSSARTMCVRLNPVSSGVSGYALSYGAVNAGENSFLYSGGSGGITFGNFAHNLIAPVTLRAETWTHFCGVLAVDGKASIFLNGRIANGGGPTDLYFSTALNGNLMIGARSDSAFRWAGSLDDIRIYSRALSPVEILELDNY